MKDYEIMFILSTQLTDEEKKANIELVETTLTKAGAVELKTEVLGEKKLAYPIKKEVSGYYYVMTVEVTHETLQEFDRKVSINENVLRHLIIKIEGE